MNQRTAARSQQREQQWEETHRRLYQAALTVFRRDGVAGCRIEDVAELVGVSRGAFYFHFPTKDEVLLERLREGQAAVVDALDAVPEDAPLSAVTAALAHAMAAHWEGDPKLLPEVGLLAIRLTANGTLTSQSDPVRAAVALRFARAAGRGALREEIPPELLSDLLLTNVFACALAWCFQPMAPLEAMLLGLIELFFAGAARPVPPIPLRPARTKKTTKRKSR